MESVTLFFIALAGLIVGSFLNVCIVRLPLEKSVVRPRSHCVHCQTPIAWYDNIPILSYLWLGGRCRHCQERISFRYVAIEILTAAVFAAFYKIYGLTPLFGAYAVMMCCFIVATFVDFEHRIIPDEVSIGGMLAGLVLSFFIPELHGAARQSGSLLPHEISLGRSCLGLFVGGGSIYFMGIVGDFIFKKETIGGGDVKLMALIGAFLGWKLALLSFFIAPFFGMVYGIVEKIRTKDSAIAYGPFLALGALISLFWGNQILDWLLFSHPLAHI